MKFTSDHKCCSFRQRTLDKDIMKFMYSLSKEVFYTLPPRLKLFTEIYMYCNKIKKEHDTVIQDDNCGNIIAPTNYIEKTDIDDTEVINKNLIINDDIIDNTMNMTPDSKIQLLDTELF